MAELDEAMVEFQISESFSGIDAPHSCSSSVGLDSGSHNAPG